MRKTKVILNLHDLKTQPQKYRTKGQDHKKMVNRSERFEHTFLRN